MDNNEVYQNVLDSILSLGISEWENVVFFSEYGNGSYEMKFYVKSNGAYKDCFSLGVPDKTIMDMFFELDKKICDFRKNISDNKRELWSVMTIIFGSDLQFKAEFDYSEIDDDISYKSEWKKKYLV